MVGDFAKKVANAIEACPALVIGFHCEPWGLGNIAMGKHLIFGAGEILPMIPGFQVHFA